MPLSLCLNALGYWLRKEGDKYMKIVKFIAVVAFVAASFGLGACASKPAPAPMTQSYTK